MIRRSRWGQVTKNENFVFRDLTPGVVAFLVLGAVAVAAQTPVRDQAAALGAGTGVIGGIVTTDDPSPRPLRRAAVLINHVDRLYGDAAVTDDQGRFELRGVPAGRYTITAALDGYIRTRYGATRPGRPGTPLVLADGQRVVDLRLKLPRGAVLTGIVRDPNGEPAPDVGVTAFRVITDAGIRRPDTESSLNGSDVTDDHGVFRVFGLAAGDYIVRAKPRELGFGVAMGIHPITRADIQWANAQLSPAAVGSAGAKPATPDSASVAYPGVFYPSSTLSADATIVSLATGEERGGIDIGLRVVPTSTVSGVVVNSAGEPVDARVLMIPGNVEGRYVFEELREAGGSTFSFGGVPAGTYSIVAQDAKTSHWARATITAAGQPLTGLRLTLQPGMVVSGRVTFERSTREIPTDVTGYKIQLSPLATDGLTMGRPAATVAADGTFSVSGLMPGRYLVSARDPAATSTGAPWLLKSARTEGIAVDAADVPIDLQPGGDRSGLVVTMTDRTAELTGLLQDASGRAAPDYYIILFDKNRETWRDGSRRIQSVRPASDGRFVIRNLPAGDYLLAALTDVEPREWFKPSFLDQITPSAVSISIGDGEKKTQNIQIAKTGGGDR